MLVFLCITHREYMATKNFETGGIKYDRHMSIQRHPRQCHCSTDGIWCSGLEDTSTSRSSTQHNKLVQNMTWHEKTMLMYTNYISLHYFNYLTFCVSYTSSVNCIGFPVVSCTISKSFIDTLCLDKSY